jgi:hypothetical protein
MKQSMRPKKQHPAAVQRPAQRIAKISTEPHQQGGEAGTGGEVPLEAAHGPEGGRAASSSMVIRFINFFNFLLSLT